MKLRPHVASEGANATYDKQRREIRFGYAANRLFPGGRVYACLSHDIIAHEMTHALIDGLRSRLTIPTGPDVLGFHEGLSDIVAVFHHFLYPEVLAAQIQRVGADVDHSEMLTQIAANFGLTTIGSDAVRTTAGSTLKMYDGDRDAHEIGCVLAAAIFSAYVKVFRRKTEQYVRLAGPQAPGFRSQDLVQVLAQKAADLAKNFLEICIRAIDYCPPVDLELGEYLRALITADHNLVPGDPWGYRETLIDCFAERGIYPHGAISLSEDALLWRPPARQLPPLAELSFSSLRFDGDPATPASGDEMYRQARALAEYLTQPQWRDEFGLMSTDSRDVDPPCIQSIRTARRVGPDGQVVFDLVAEVTQRRIVKDPANGGHAKFVGGSTILIGPRGEIRYVISKNIRNQGRVDQQLKFQKEQSEFWTIRDHQYRLTDYALPLVHMKRTRLPA